MNSEHGVQGLLDFYQQYVIQTADSTLFLLIFISSIISLLIACLLTWLLPVKHKAYQQRYFYLIWVFGTFIPVFGALLIGLMIYMMLFIGKQQKDMPIKQVITPTFSLEENANIKTQGEGSARTQVQLKKLSNETRTESLLALSALNNSKANEVIRETMADEDDQIRLLAFALLSNKESAIHNNINNLEDKLAKPQSQDKQGELFMQLAFAYWELIYLNLASGELYTTLIDRAQDYAEKAIEIISNHADLWVLLGKIYLHQGDFNKSYAAFGQAREMGVAYNKYAPYMAEIHFKKGDFNAIKFILEDKPMLHFIPKIGPVIKYWCHND